LSAKRQFANDGYMMVVITASFVATRPDSVDSLSSAVAKRLTSAIASLYSWCR